jgi:hypothetical protein
MTTKKETKTAEPLAAFKGFDKNMKCRDFQYKEGETYEHTGPIGLCKSGFHVVELPLDALTYFQPGESLYHRVDLYGVSDEREADSKRVGRKITIGASLGIPGLVKAHVEAIWAKATEGNDKPTNGTNATSGYGSNSATSGDGSHSATSGDRSNSATSGDRSNSATSGDRSNSATSGNGSHSATSGKYSNSATSGDRSHSATSGDRSNSATSGDRSHSATSGDRSNSATSGNGSNSATSGKYSNSATSGYGSQAEVKDEGSIAAVIGSGSAAGAEGCWLVLTERDVELNILGVVAVPVDGKKVKAGVFYELRDGKVVAA